MGVEKKGFHGGWLLFDGNIREGVAKTVSLGEGGKDGGVSDRCLPYRPRKGCDVSCVNLTLIRRVINARVCT